jgi:hypothetical protein
MSAQPSTAIAEPPLWSGWQNAVINGVYPLKRLLHGSEHSAVFLTERKSSGGIADAALKIMPIERVTLAQLSHWKVATALSHPHLIQLFDTGLCHLAGRQFLFVVMEYAQQTLPEVLARRALTADEVRELLEPTLKALTFLHGQRLVLAHLRPANILVVDDQLKLASDSIRTVGAPRVGFAEPSFYDAPEANEAPFSTADDIWGLGVTLVEALTQRLPWSDAQAAGVRLPDSVPSAFLDTVQQCLRPDPAARPQAGELSAQFGGAPEAPLPPVPPVPDPLAVEAPRPLTPVPEHHTPRARLPIWLVVGSLLLVAAVWADLRLFHRHTTGARQVAAVPEEPAAHQPPVARQIAAATTTSVAAGAAIVHKQLPDIARGALATIHGRVKVGVVAILDQRGDVIEARLKNPGPSSYFASRARDAARRWKFAPTEAQGTREWLLRFEFARGGITASAAPAP